MLPTMPVIFFGHGSPMNAIEQNQFTIKWKELAKRIPRPKIILSISAHWETSGVKLTGNTKQKTIHDFGGFPQKLYDQQYTPNGSPELCKRIQQIIPGAKIDNSWGLDHGTWTILIQMYPEQDIPVIQLSLNSKFNEKEHYTTGKRLQELRKEGVLIIGSGNIIHSFKEMEWSETAKPLPWAIKFNELVKNLIINRDHEKLINYKQLESGTRASPTPEHYLPLLYVLGSSKDDDQITFFNDELKMASFSMNSILFGF